MVNHIRQTLELLRATQTASISMRRKLIAYWASMLFVVFAALLVLASIFGMFSISETSLKHTLETHHSSTTSSINKQADVLTARVIVMPQEASAALDKHLLTSPAKSLNDDPDNLLSAERALFPTLSNALEASPCNGVFAIIDATVNTDADSASTSRAGIYLRYANLNVNESANQDVVLYRGIADIARENSTELHNRWRLEFDTSLIPLYKEMLTRTGGVISSDSRWTNRTNLTDTWENAVMLVAPIYSSSGKVNGICGVELSDLFLGLSYPSQQSEYGSMVTVIAPKEDNAFSLAKGMTGELDATYLSDSDTLYVSKKSGYNVYTGSSGSFIGLHTKLDLSTATDNEVYALTLIPESYFDSMVLADRIKIICVSLCLFGCALLLSRYLSKRFVQPLTDAIDALKSDESNGRKSTGFSEIDALVAALDSKTANLKPNLLPPDVASLLDEFKTRFSSLTATERRIVGLYSEKLEAGDVAQRMFISIHTVRKHNANVYRKLNVGSREELVLYLELFRRCKQLDELFGPDETNGSQKQ